MPNPRYWLMKSEPTAFSFGDLVKFFEKLSNPDKQFAVMPGIAHASLQQKNCAIVYHILLSFFTQPEPVYRGGH